MNNFYKAIHSIRLEEGFLVDRRRVSLKEVSKHFTGSAPYFSYHIVPPVPCAAALRYCFYIEEEFPDADAVKLGVCDVDSSGDLVEPSVAWSLYQKSQGFINGSSSTMEKGSSFRLYCPNETTTDWAGVVVVWFRILYLENL